MAALEQKEPVSGAGPFNGLLTWIDAPESPKNGASLAIGSPSTGVTRTTSAPASASRRPARMPFQPALSITRSPARGPFESIKGHLTDGFSYCENGSFSAPPVGANT